MLPALFLVGLASLHAPSPVFANYVFTIPVRIESMTHITAAHVSCTLSHTSPTTAPTSLGSARTAVPIVDGNFAGNRHLVYPDNTQRCANLLLGILHVYGIEQPSIGESTGPLELA